MKRFFLYTAISIFAAAASTNAQQRGTDTHLYGHVVEQGSGEHLPYINIVIKGTTIGTATDASGHYFLKNLPEGDFTVEASLLGYTTQSQKVTLRAGEATELNFVLAEQAMQLDGVVVSASRSETSKRQAPALVSIINAELFNKINAATLSEGLCFQPGLRVEDDCQNCGFMQVRINGLDGHYSQILIDSHPVFSALSGVYGLEQIPASMIERVEVLRGGGSALFGSSAIGGTVNVITRDPLRNSAEASHTITSIGLSTAFDNITSANASLVTDNRRAGLYVYGQNRHRSGYDRNGDGFTEIPALQSLSYGMRSFLKTGTYSRLTLQYSGVNEYRRGGDKLNRPPHEALIAEQTDHAINSGSLAFDISSPDFANRFNAYFSFNNTARKSYYGAGQDPDAYGRTHDLTLAAGAQYIHSFRRLLFMPADLTAGVEYNYNSLEDESLGYDHHTMQHVHIYSAYAQNEWRNDKWSFLIGCRMDKHTLIKRAIFSPRANIRFNPTKDINLRVSYSSGFRAPQAFDEDMHIAIVGGERVAIRLADNLREERSHSVSLSADLYHTFGSVQTNLLVEGFFTTLDDVFVLRETGLTDTSGATIKERTNGTGAMVMGMNIEGKAAFTSWFQLQAGVTLQRSRYKVAEQWSDNPDTPAERRMFRTPDVYGYLTSTITPVKHFDIALSGTYTGSMLVQHIAGSGTPVDVAVRTPRFFDLGIKLSYEIPFSATMAMEVNCGVQNIFNAYQRDFDKGAERDSGYIYGPSMPRSIYAGVKFRF
ncbi:MAG: TonB-dependent receptor [Alistipes sp.]|nr:TonB-dependent receptor [Alistipes sp.]